MLSDEMLEKVVERLTNRIEQGNTYVIEEIGKSIKQIGTLTPSKARQLEQILKYGGNYQKIIRKLKEITKLNVKDINKIFEEVSKTNYDFAEQFYKYRNQKYIPFEENKSLQNQISTLTDEITKSYIQLTNTKALGFTVKDPKTKKEVFRTIKQVYYDTIDTAILNVSQGKTSFDEELYKVINELGESGIKTLNYEGNRHVRLDSAVRMQMRDALRDLHNKNQELIGKQFGSDGVEISVHLNPAPDHALVQGKQFSINKYDENGKLIKKGEFEKFQSDEDAKSYDGTFFSRNFEGHDRRSISQYNCHHYTTNIILGVNKPSYTDEQLKKIIEDNEKGFEFEGKHYTNYEGTQLQRKLETEIRKQKDIQIGAREAGISKEIDISQKKIDIYMRKYDQLSKISGLEKKEDRMRVKGYNKVTVK